MARLIDKQVLFEGRKVKLEIHHMEHEDGRRFQMEVINHPGAVVILPILKTGEVILIRNRRHAIGQVLLELPAGTIDKGEEPMNCAGRELQEETGYLAGRLKLIGTFFSSPGVMTERMFAFAAYDLRQTESALEADEEIETEKVRFEDAMELVRTGNIVDAKTIATLLMFDRFHRNPG
jgi:ADP-ribose pyrophosphatase